MVDDPSKLNRRVALIAASGAAVMLGLGFASVPLYRLFCQATGFDGTTQRVSEAQAAEFKATGDAMSIRFDANVERGMPWQFKPEQLTQEITLGGRKMAIYLARNTSDHPITGRATFNVEPEAAGKYFNKVQCFCFTEQTLQPHQEVRMPVVFYVDPKIKDDPDAKDIEQITLSYTFHHVANAVANPTAKPLDQAGTGG
ncbi:MAG: cytochrome c oxidase assembly protein [Novosphingobium sp.]